MLELDPQQPPAPAVKVPAPAVAPPEESWVTYALRIAKEMMETGKEAEKFYSVVMPHLQYDVRATEEARRWLLSVADCIRDVAESAARTGAIPPELFGQIVGSKVRLIQQIANTGFASSLSYFLIQLQIVEDVINLLPRLRSDDSREAQMGLLKQVEGFFRGVASGSNQPSQ